MNENYGPTPELIQPEAANQRPQTAEDAYALAYQAAETLAYWYNEMDRGKANPEAAFEAQNKLKSAIHYAQDVAARYAVVEVQKEAEIAWKAYDEAREARDFALGRTISHADETLQLRHAIFDTAVGFPPETKTSAWADHAQRLAEALDEYVEARLIEARAALAEAQEEISP